MISADRAHTIMQRYEADYDQFLSGLKKKHQANQQKAAAAQADANNSKQTLQEAQDHKKRHLAQKAQVLLDKAGGIEGAAHTANNVIKYFKDDSPPSDYSVSLGEQKEGDITKPADDKAMKIFGMSAVVAMAGGTIVTLAIIYGIYRLLKPAPPVQQIPSTTTIPHP